MPEIKRKKKDPNQPKEKDIIVKVGRFRFYFQNYYTIISLSNDLLLGGLYTIGSLIMVFEGPQWISQYTYLAGSFFMLMRPVLKIFRNIFIYDDKNMPDENIHVKSEDKESK